MKYRFTTDFEASPYCREILRQRLEAIELLDEFYSLIIDYLIKEVEWTESDFVGKFLKLSYTHNIPKIYIIKRQVFEPIYHIGENRLHTIFMRDKYIDFKKFFRKLIELEVTNVDYSDSKNYRYDNDGITIVKADHVYEVMGSEFRYSADYEERCKKISFHSYGLTGPSTYGTSRISIGNRLFVSTTPRPLYKYHVSSMTSSVYVDGFQNIRKYVDLKQLAQTNGICLDRPTDKDDVEFLNLLVNSMTPNY